MEGDTIFLMTEAGPVEMHGQLFESEDDLQGLVADHPGLLAGHPGVGAPPRPASTPPSEPGSPTSGARPRRASSERERPTRDASAVIAPAGGP